MKVFLASDHAGFELKEEIKKYLLKKGITVDDCGAKIFQPEDDYPDFVQLAAKKVAEDSNTMGIVFGKSGAGEAITANKIKGIRAIVGFSKENVILSRQHNNANILSLGSQFTLKDQAKELVDLFLNTPFSNEERHKRRIGKITKIEKES